MEFVNPYVVIPLLHLNLNNAMMEMISLLMDVTNVNIHAHMDANNVSMTIFVKNVIKICLIWISKLVSAKKLLNQSIMNKIIKLINHKRMVVIIKLFNVILIMY